MSVALVTAVVLYGQTQTPTKEYVRLGDRVIAIENGAAPVISPAILTIGSLDTQTFTATCGSAACASPNWTTAGGGTISTAGLYTPPNHFFASPYTGSVSVAATSGGVSSLAYAFTVLEVLTPSATYDFPSAGATQSFTINKSGNWSISLTAPFTIGSSGSASTTGAGTQSIQITAPQNSTSGTISGTVTVVDTASGRQEQIPITQDAPGAAPPSISVAPPTTSTTPLTIGGQGGTAATPVTVTVVNGAQWTIDNTNATWVTGLPTGTQNTTQTVNWGAAVNPSSSSLAGYLLVHTIQNGSVVSTAPPVYVTQSGGVTLSPPFGSETHLTNANGSQGTVTVTAPAGTNWTVTGVPSWLTVTPLSGGSGTTQLTYAANGTIAGPRTANFSIGGLPYEVEEDPVAVGLTISPTNWQILAPATTQAFYAYYNGTLLSNSQVTWSSSPAGTTMNYGSTTGACQIANVETLCVPVNFSGPVTVSATYNGTTVTSYGAIVVTAPGQTWNVSFSSGQSSGNNNGVIVTLPGPANDFVISGSTNPYTLYVAVTSGNTGSTPNVQNSCYLSWTFDGAPYFPIQLFGDDGASMALNTLYGNPNGPQYLAQQQGGQFFNNSQCWWDLSSTTVQNYPANGSSMQPTMHLLFNPNWAGQKQIWIKATAASLPYSSYAIPWTEFWAYNVVGYAPPSVGFSTATSQAASSSSSSAPITGPVTLQGWAVDNASVAETKIQSVQILVDNTLVGNASINQAVPSGTSGTPCQVATNNAQAFTPQIPNCPSPATGTSGTATTTAIADTSWWTYNWSPAGLSTGTHTVTVVAKDNDPSPTGPQSTSQSLTFYVSNAGPDLSITKHHTGNFAQGDTGDSYTITVNNVGASASSGIVTVADSLPAGLTATAIGGNGWSGCTAMPATGPATLTCMRSDALISGSSYSPLLVTVNVSNTAPATVTNSATVSGGGDVNSNNNTANDATTVNPSQFQVTINAMPAGSGILVSVDGGTPATSLTATWQSGASHSISTTSPQGTGGTQHTWASWSDLGAVSHTVTASASVTTYTANFTTSYQLTTSASTGGTVSPASGSYYGTGTVVNLTATPTTGYVFSNWTGNVANPSSPTTTVTMSQAQTVAANFVAASTVATPTFTPASGTYSTAQSVTIGTITSGASIRYTTDGSTPSETAGTAYSAPFMVSSTSTVKAVAYKTGITDSSVSSVTYTISGGASWYNSSWAYRKQITVGSSAVSGTLTNFPMLVSWPSDSNLVAPNVQTNGNDILFTASDGVTKLNHEIELYISSTGQLAAWVQIPSLSSGAVIYMYYGNSSAGSQQNVTGAWDANYMLVQHLSNNGALSLNDSTTHGFNFTNNSTAAIAGEISGGADSTGTGATKYAMDATSSLIFNAGDTVTLEAWVKRTDLNPNWNKYQSIFSIGNATSGKNNLFFGFGTGNFGEVDNALTFGFTDGGGSTDVDFFSHNTADSDTTNFHHYVFTYTYGTGSTAQLYEDGVNVTSTSGWKHNVGNDAPDTTANTMYLFASPTLNVNLGGIGDEIRVSKGIARSSTWIAAEYNNQSAPGSFYSVGGQQTSGGGSTVPITMASSPSGLSLTVNGTSCTSPCTFQWTPGTSQTIAVTTTTQTGTSGTQYVYSSWNIGSASSQTITVPSTAGTYTATFSTQYYLTTSASPTAGGSISPSSGWYNSGATASVSASANSGYTFSGYSGALSGTTTPQNLTISAPQTVTANFGALTGVTVTSSPAGLALVVDSASCTSPCSYQWISGSAHTIAVAVSPQAGSTGIQYVYASWSDIGAQSHSITAPSSATTYTASFTTQYYLTTVAIPSAGGSVSPGSGWYNSGVTPSISATATLGYTFSGFGGGLTGATTPQTVTMSGPVSVTANFTSILVSVAPPATTLNINQTQQFTQTVTGTTNSAVTWSINPSVGSISASGFYTAPSSLASTQTVTVTALSQAASNRSGTATITLSAVTVAVSPPSTSLSASQTAQFNATVGGTSNTAVNWSINPAVGSVSAGGLYTAPSSIASQQTVTVTATSQLDSSKSSAAVVTLQPTISVSVSPTTASLYYSQTNTFTATVVGTTNTAVTWSATIGTINSHGIYTAPSSISSVQNATITATSVVDTAKSASASVTLNPTIVVTVQPVTATMDLGTTYQFSASLTNTSNSAVTWTAVGTGTISSTGLYMPPLGISDGNGGGATIYATSVADPRQSASASISINPSNPPWVSGTLPSAFSYINTYYNYSLYAHPMGTIQNADFWITYNVFDQGNFYGCRVHYDTPSNTISVGGLDGNGNDAWLYSAAPGTTGAIYTGYQCTVDISQSSATIVSGSLSLQLSISYNSQKSVLVYGSAIDYSGLSSGTTSLGNLTYH